ncbi:amino acid permease/ SLC12A domain-containing protein [Stachybotrys elegans]|uniref:Amino acid permease/ SLC12A domain-containing protein n=1 Tax=Stachybotrys elegans TaxID=80388 RepID=A0A8K0T3H7_9HYPO|nr:amino acid permease/ SLC12A domain-containing protein [Stachybotrys elegans]
MIAIGGAIGTGLIIGTGRALANSGPGSLFIGYLFMGAIVWVVMCAVGEMAAWLPMSAGFAGYATRYCHPSLGFALGWSYLFKYLIITPNQLTAAALAFQFWVDRDTVNPGVFIAIFLIAIFCINFFGGIKFFGEFEFWLSSFKVVVILGIILFSLCIACGAGPHADGAPGFRSWSDPGAFKELAPLTGDVGRFAGFWAVMVNATFAYLGTELVGVTAAEAQSRAAVSKAIKLTFYRILIFYCLSVLLVGMIVPWDSPQMAFALDSPSTNANASPFVAAANIAGVQVLPHILNVCILFFVFSAANSDLYIGSRTLYALASDRSAPAIFKLTNARGVPYPAMFVCTAFALLAFLNVTDDSRTVFLYFVNLVTIFGLLTWVSILVSHIFFIRARRAQGIEDSQLTFKAPLGIWGSYVALFFCILVSLTKNFDIFIDDGEPFDYRTFITGYLGIPVYIIFLFGHMYLTKSKGVKPAEADFYLGRDIVEAQEAEYYAAEEAKKASAPTGHWDAFYRRYIAWLF